jgi:hypothetical protein
MEGFLHPLERMQLENPVSRPTCEWRCKSLSLRHGRMKQCPLGDKNGTCNGPHHAPDRKKRKNLFFAEHYGGSGFLRMLILKRLYLFDNATDLKDFSATIVFCCPRLFAIIRVRKWGQKWGPFVRQTFGKGEK